MGAPAQLPTQPVMSVIQRMGAPKRLDRDRALEEFTSCLAQPGTLDDVEEIQEGVKRLLSSDAWEEKLGGLMASKVLIASLQLESFDVYMIAECLRLLEDSEVRVRLAVGTTLEALARKHGVSVFLQCRERVLHSIFSNFDRAGEGENDDEQAQSSGDAPAAEASTSTSLPSSSSTSSSGDLISSLLQSTYKPAKMGTGEMRHGTEGWKCLETSMKALQLLMEGTRPAIRPYIISDIRQLLYRSLHHPNRFVRETGHFAMASLCETLAAGVELEEVGQELAPRLADGLSDNWSQVRYAACVAARTFMLSLGEQSRQAFLPALVAPMCLNRYYVAEGVRLYAQESWRLVMGDNGRAAVAQHIAQVVPYYIGQSKANNHAVREAACACIAELMEKVERAAVAPHVGPLLRTLVLCFKDMSWPVRDAACTACGRCALAYPNESRPVLEELYGLWFAHLWDNIPTVRENSAQALGKALAAYGQEALDRVLPVLRELLPMAHEQPSESERYSGLSNTTQFGVAERRARDNDPEVHTGQDMFSCGSLVARFSTSYLIKSDGCMDHGFSRDKQAWEASDGAVWMLKELAMAAPETVPDFLPQLSRLAALATFQHAFNLHETIWRALPVIAAGMGARAFKQHLELFLPAMFADLRCGHQLAEAAAGRCIGALRDFLGPRIFAGRLDDEQRELLEHDPNVPPVRGTAAVGAAAGMAPTTAPWAKAAAGAGGAGMALRSQ